MPTTHGTPAAHVAEHTLHAVPFAISAAVSGASALLSCADRTAYASLVTMHGKGNSTRFAKFGLQISTMVMRMIRVLVHSIRRVERGCRRDFVLLVGDRVKLPEHHLEGLQRDGVKLKVVPPIRLGVPSMDKLHAWTLTEYSNVLYIDADSLVLRPLDELFTSFATPGLVIAQHPYDLVQGQRCGIPIGKRGVGALLSLRPDRATFNDLVRNLSLDYDAEHLNHYSEQTGVACYFHSRQQLRTLPCATFYDATTERHVKATQGMEAAMHQAFTACIKWAGVPRKQCEEVSSYIRHNCMWSSVHSMVHAVHFKGKTKPWHHVNPLCRPVISGRLMVSSVTAGNVTLDPAMLGRLDDVYWVGSRAAGSCMSRGRDMVLLWSGSDKKHLKVPKRCCTFNTMLAAEWNGQRVELGL